MKIGIIISELCFFAWLFLLAPSLLYLLTEWKTRFEMLKAVLDDKALRLYFSQFFPSKKDIQNDIWKEFEKLFFPNYGRRTYFIPLLLLALISGSGLILVGYNLFYWLNIVPNLMPIHPVAISAFLGAYMWVAYDQLRRFRMRDFTFHDVYNCSFRFLIAVPLGFSFAAIFKDDFGITSAFLLGTFPTKTLFKLGKRFVAQKFNMKSQDTAGTLHELEQLQCINREEAERYQEEGTTNILQLAYSDPVDLTIRTNFDFNYVVDCISQALLWLYVGKDIDKLRPLGLRGAQEASELHRCLHSTDPHEKKMAEGNFSEIAKVLHINENSFKSVLFEITEDPYTEFICEIWQ
jgi:hypothetical protein